PRSSLRAARAGARPAPGGDARRDREPARGAARLPGGAGAAPRTRRHRRLSGGDVSPALRRLLPRIGLALLCGFYLGAVGGHPLQDPDEGRYAEIPREMIESGDWVTPRLNYVAYFEKPPLVYWLVALSFELFGMSEGAARAVPAAAGILTVVVAFVLG